MCRQNAYRLREKGRKRTTTSGFYSVLVLNAARRENSSAKQIYLIFYFDASTLTQVPTIVAVQEIHLKRNT